MDQWTGAIIVLLGGIGGALGAWLKEFLSGSGRKAGEIDAVKHQLDEVLRQLQETTRVTETIKATVSAGVWIDQERWKLKRDAYLRLMGDLEEMSRVLMEAAVMSTNTTERVVLTAALQRRAQVVSQEQRAESSRALHVARLIMVPDALEAIEGLSRGFAVYVEAALTDQGQLRRLIEQHRIALDKLVSAAKKDLQLGPPLSPPVA